MRRLFPKEKLACTALKLDAAITIRCEGLSRRIPKQPQDNLCSYVAVDSRECDCFGVHDASCEDCCAQFDVGCVLRFWYALGGFADCTSVHYVQTHLEWVQLCNGEKFA